MFKDCDKDNEFAPQSPSWATESQHKEDECNLLPIAKSKPKTSSLLPPIHPLLSSTLAVQKYSIQPVVFCICIVIIFLKVFV